MNGLPKKPWFETRYYTRVPGGIWEFYSSQCEPRNRHEGIRIMLAAGFYFVEGREILFVTAREGFFEEAAQ